MKRRLWAIMLSVIMTVQTGISASAANQDIAMSVQTAETVQMEGVYSASGDEHVLQRGAMGTVYYYPGGEDVLRGDYEWEPAFRERLADAMENLETIVYINDLEISCDSDIFLDIYWDEINMNPQCFYISGYVSYSYDRDGNYYYVTLNYEDKYVNDDGSLNMVVLDADKTAYEKRVEEALSYVDDRMTDVEKVLAVHDFIVRECDYDYGNYLAGTIPWESYAANGAFINNVAVCNGYALAMIDCLNRLGITNAYVSSDAINHAWNMVYLDGYWYHVDATWDDPTTSGGDYVVEGRVRHNNFVCSDTEITATGHYGWDEDVPKATNDGAYAGYAFRNADWALNYYDGLWYTLESYYSVIASEITGNNKHTISSNTYYKYMHGIGDAMYLADNKGIYKLSASDFNTLETVRIFTEEAEYINSVLAEFTIKNRQFVAVLNDNDIGTSIRLVFDIEGLEAIPDTYTVYFNTNGGSEIAGIQDVVTGSTVDKPADPIREGYRFLGWYKDAELTTPWNFEMDTITGNTVIYAKWELLPIAVTGIELRCSQLTMEVGDVDILTVTILPENATDKSVTWESSNSAVATVDGNGRVTAIGGGEAIITVRTANGLTATCAVTVTVAITSVTLNTSELTLNVGDDAELAANIAPADTTNDKTLTWSSDNSEIAVVDVNGKVTAKAEGTATITVTTVNGLSATCVVTVVTKDVLAESVSLSQNAVNLEKGEAVDLVATVLPEDTTDKSVTWESSDPAVATVDGNGRVTAIGGGKAIITVKTANSLTATCAVTVSKTAILLDVEEGQWYTDPINYVFDEGLMTGTAYDEDSNATFEPFKTLSREMLAQILYAAEGKPAYETDKTFTDLEDGGWYVDAVLWAAENGIVSGIGEGKFGVGQDITREQLALMLYQYAKLKGYDVSLKEDISSFTDVADVSNWAEEAVQWAVGNGIISGATGSDGISRILSPKDGANRAACATMLKAFMVKYFDAQ